MAAFTDILSVEFVGIDATGDPTAPVEPGAKVAAKGIFKYGVTNGDNSSYRFTFTVRAFLSGTCESTNVVGGNQFTSDKAGTFPLIGGPFIAPLRWLQNIWENSSTGPMWLSRRLSAISP